MITANMHCPKCGAPALQEDSGNGGTLYVAEDLESCTECFDGDIEMFVCTANGQHIFYVSK